MEFQTLTVSEMENIVISSCSQMPNYKRQSREDVRVLESIEDCLNRTRLIHEIPKLWGEFLFQWNQMDESKRTFNRVSTKSFEGDAHINRQLKRDILYALFIWHEKRQTASPTNLSRSKLKRTKKKKTSEASKN